MRPEMYKTVPAAKGNWLAEPHEFEYEMRKNSKNTRSKRKARDQLKDRTADLISSGQGREAAVAEARAQLQREAQIRLQKRERTDHKEYVDLLQHEIEKVCKENPTVALYRASIEATDKGIRGFVVQQLANAEHNFEARYTSNAGKVMRVANPSQLLAHAARLGIALEGDHFVKKSQALRNWNSDCARRRQRTRDQRLVGIARSIMERFHVEASLPKGTFDVPVLGLQDLKQIQSRKAALSLALPLLMTTRLFANNSPLLDFAKRVRASGLRTNTIINFLLRREESAKKAALRLSQQLLMELGDVARLGFTVQGDQLINLRARTQEVTDEFRNDVEASGHSNDMSFFLEQWDIVRDDGFETVVIAFTEERRYGNPEEMGPQLWLADPVELRYVDGRHTLRIIYDRLRTIEPNPGPYFGQVLDAFHINHAMVQHQLGNFYALCQDDQWRQIDLLVDVAGSVGAHVWAEFQPTGSVVVRVPDTEGVLFNAILARLQTIEKNPGPAKSKEQNKEPKQKKKRVVDAVVQNLVAQVQDAQGAVDAVKEVREEEKKAPQTLKDRMTADGVRAYDSKKFYWKSRIAQATCVLSHTEVFPSVDVDTFELPLPVKCPRLSWWVGTLVNTTRSMLMVAQQVVKIAVERTAAVAENAERFKHMLKPQEESSSDTEIEPEFRETEDVRACYLGSEAYAAQEMRKPAVPIIDDVTGAFAGITQATFERIKSDQEEREFIDRLRDVTWAEYAYSVGRRALSKTATYLFERARSASYQMAYIGVVGVVLSGRVLHSLADGLSSWGVYDEHLVELNNPRLVNILDDRRQIKDQNTDAQAFETLFDVSWQIVRHIGPFSFVFRNGASELMRDVPCRVAFDSKPRAYELKDEDLKVGFVRMQRAASINYDASANFDNTPQFAVLSAMMASDIYMTQSLRDQGVFSVFKPLNH